MKTKKRLSPEKARTRNLTLLLLRDDVKSPVDALKAPNEVQEHPWAPGLRMRGGLFLSATTPNSPRWIEFLQEGFSDLPSLTSSAPLGVLFIHADTRLFALTLGHGRHLLRPESFELDFGLKVTLNTADASKLRSLDLRTFEELTVHTRLQVSRASPLTTFNVDVSRDMLRAFTGEPRDATLAKRFTGKDALVINGPVRFSELEEKCTRLLKEFHSDEYKKEFAWVDNIKAIRDTSLVDKLDAKVLKMLSERSFDNAHLAPPDMLEWNEVPGFQYPGERKDIHSDMDLAECLDAIARFEQTEPEELAFAIEDLKKRYKIRVVVDEHGRERERWAVYDCLVLELDEKDALYVLSGGQWFRIEKDFVGAIKNRVATLARDMPRLPLAEANQVEGAYNRKAHRGSKAFALLDEELVRCERAHTSIEPCDLLTEEGPNLQFIHVKRKTRSSTLSHLFAQGVVSAQAFLGDMAFRKGLKQVVSKQGRPNLVRRLGDPAKRPSAETCEVIFAVIAGAPKRGAKWPLSLPFFSQLNLSNAAERLQDLGCKVGICRVDIQ
ncbi:MULTISPECIES: DUF6119 family protein [Myxococcus]|uniref:DUF6119 family protein n=1 Tax=Myxococcus TaxID=32 RepID=UPI001127B4C4|nr:MULTISPECIES: DUF6119 family protein [Myxococcus]QDE80774.1 hypothetical protein BHS07_03955 [Myxococcus xanthus]WAM27301.1 TIGR04141 family sporadically distributed protein [Myxococcus sp. NMCA1]